MEEALPRYLDGRGPVRGPVPGFAKRQSWLRKLATRLLGRRLGGHLNRAGEGCLTVLVWACFGCGGRRQRRPTDLAQRPTRALRSEPSGTPTDMSQTNGPNADRFCRLGQHCRLCAYLGSHARGWARKSLPGLPDKETGVLHTKHKESGNDCDGG